MLNKVSRNKICYILLFLPMFLSVKSFAEIPKMMNIQGRLTNKDGSPIITSTPVRFEIFQGGDEQTGGALVFQEDATVQPNQQGIFAHLIGSGQILFGGLNADTFSTDTTYLQITMNPATLPDILKPRQRLVSVSYAFQSGNADYAEKSKTAESADIAQTVPDNSITPQKLSEDVSKSFMMVSTEPATAGMLVFPSTVAIISASTPDGQITLANDTRILGKLSIGHTVTIGTTVENTDEIVFTNLAGVIRTLGNNALTLQTGGAADLNLNPGGQIILGANVDSDLTFQGAQTINTTMGGALTLNSAGGSSLNLNTGANGPLILGNVNTPNVDIFSPLINLQGTAPVIQSSAGNTLTLNSDTGLNLNTLNNTPIITGTGLTAFGGDVQINGGNILDINGTPWISLDPSTGETTITGNINATVNIANDSILSQHINEADGTSGQDTTTGSGIKTGHIQNGAITSAQILDQTIVDADVSNTAGIAPGKIAGTAVISNNSGTPNSIAMFTGTSALGNSSIYETATGNVGIGGTGTLYGKLHIRSNNQTELYLEDATSDVAGISFIAKDYNGATRGSSIGFFANTTDEDSYVYIADSYNNRVLNVTKGKVGIGTTSPNSLMHIKSDSTFNTGWTPGIDQIFLDNTPGAGLNKVSGSIGFASAASTQRGAAIAAVQTDVDKDMMGLAFYTHPNPTSTADIVEQMRITESGNVGIGTTSPSAKLDVEGNANVAGNINVSGNIMNKGNFVPRCNSGEVKLDADGDSAWIDTGFGDVPFFAYAEDINATLPEVPSGARLYSVNQGGSFGNYYVIQTTTGGNFRILSRNWSMANQTVRWWAFTMF